ncbi:MAG: hypothetical protein ACQEXE_10260 [Bacillota bacterium]
MKHSVVTGGSIFNQIQKLTEEVNELGRALDELEQGTLPHRLLENAWEEKKKELSQAKYAEYTA